MNSRDEIDITVNFRIVWKKGKKYCKSLRVEIYLYLSRSITVDRRFGRHQQRRHCHPASPVPIKSPSSSLRNWYRETKTPIPGVYFVCYVFAAYICSIRVYIYIYIFDDQFRVYIRHTFLLLAHVHSHSPVLEVLIDRCRSLHGWSQLNTAISRTDVGLCAELKLQGWQSNAYRSRVSMDRRPDTFYSDDRIFLPSSRESFPPSRLSRISRVVHPFCRLCSQ